MTDIILLFLGLEIVVLLAIRGVARRGMPWRECISFLGAGFAMLIALRAVAVGQHPAVFAVAMLVSLALHVWHVVQRWGIEGAKH